MDKIFIIYSLTIITIMFTIGYQCLAALASLQ